MSPGLRGITREQVIAAFERFGCAQLCDAGGGRVWPLPASLVRRTDGLRLAGPVFPVTTDNDMLPCLQALDAAPQHAVLFIANSANVSDALAGDIFVTACKAQGIAGLVVDGAIRDVDTLVAIGVCVFSREVRFVSAKTARTAAARVPDTVLLEGRELAAGDWLFGDGDGLLAIAAQDVGPVCKAAKLLSASEEELRQAVAGGARLGDVIGLADYVSGRGPLGFNV